MEHYLGESAPEPVGPEGRPIEIIEAADDVTEKRAIERLAASFVDGRRHSA